MAVVTAQLPPSTSSWPPTSPASPARRRTKNIVMTVADGARRRDRRRSCLLLRAHHRRHQGLVASCPAHFPTWFTKDIQPSPRATRPGHEGRDRRHVVITLMATLIAVPLGILGAVYLNEYGATRLFARLLRFLANVMAGVPSIVMGLFIYVVLGRASRHQRSQRLQRRAGARLPDAADRRSLDGGDAAARAPEPARRQLRARRQHAAARRSRSCCRRPRPGSSAAACSPSPAPPARPRR